MQDLRLIGVHEGGDHLLLADAEGTRYRLPLDEPLRAAARRDRPRLGQLQIEMEGGLRPRDVQALIRSGLSTEEVADRSGWTVDKVRRFEGPVLAEREYMAIRAQRTVMSHDGRVTLGARASSRLKARGVGVDDAVWDSSREDSGLWLVTVTFPAGGRQRTASWRFDPQTQQLRAQNDDARWLGEDEKAGPIPAPHVAHSGSSSDEVFDVTKPPRGLRPALPTTSRSSAKGREQEDELTESLRAHSTQRARRGRRRPMGPAHAPGEHLSPVDALPLEPLLGDLDELGPPPDRPRAEGAVVTPLGVTDEAMTGTVADADEGHRRGEVEVQVEAPTAGSATLLGEGSPERPAPSSASDPDQSSTEDRRTTADAQADGSRADVPPADLSQADASRAEPPDAEPEAGRVKREAEPDAKPEAEPEAEPETKPAETGRRGRARVPSWDDVVFGTRSRPSSPDR